MQQHQQQQQPPPWGSTSSIAPDAGFYNFFGFARSDESPIPLPAAAYQVPGGGLRPGNNTPLRPSSRKSTVPWLHAMCVPDSVADAPAPPSLDEANGFREYYYWGSGSAPPQSQAPFYGRGMTSAS